MFSGRYTYAIDDKGRLSIPAKFREALASRLDPAHKRIDGHYAAEQVKGRKGLGTTAELKLILTGLDGCIAAYPEREWEEIQDRIDNSGVSKKEARNFLRVFYGSASECPIDRLGRILIPQSLRSYGAIKKNVVIVGNNRWLEIWAEEAWAEVERKATADMEKMADIASELGL